jgi:hypothetical protein
VTIKIWDDQGVEEDRRRQKKARCEEQGVEKVAVEPKEVIEKATIKKAVIVKRVRGTRKKNEWCDKECEQLKKEAVNALTEIALRKRRGAKEQRRKGVADRNKTVYFLFFWNCYFMFKGKYTQESESP